MPYQYLLYDIKDAIVTLTLNRPERLNALGDTLREELYDAIVRTSDDPEAHTSGGYWYHQRRTEPAPSVHDRTFQDELLADLATCTDTGLS